MCALLQLALNIVNIIEKRLFRRTMPVSKQRGASDGRNNKPSSSVSQQLDSAGGNISRKHYISTLATDPEDSDGARLCLLLVDPQADFCDPKRGKLYVPGAEKDCERLVRAFRESGMDRTSAVYVTLDTHQQYHIAHALFWTSGDGGEASGHPAPFTAISREDVLQGRWRATRPEHQAWAREYVDRLESVGRFKLVIWPDHCLIGTEGHAVYPPLGEALAEWERARGAATNYVIKGNNAFTEHYSAIKAEVAMESDPSTGLNTALVNELARYDRIVVAGEALSHCVNFTVRDLVEQLPPHARGKVWVCSDACSSVAGFEAEGEAFVADMKALGVRFATTSEAFTGVSESLDATADERLIAITDRIKQS